jgi:oligosaccharide repeat unit polymerase
MNNYVLAIAVTAILVLNVALNRDCLRPSVIFGSGFVYSSVIFALHTDAWNYEISLSTLLLVALAQLAFWCGELFGYRISPPPGRVPVRCAGNNELFRKRNERMFALGLVLCLTLILVRLRNIREIWAAYGTGDYLLASARMYGGGEDAVSAIQKFLEVFCVVFAYYYFHRFCWLSAKCRIRKFRYLLPMGMVMFSSVLSTNRSGVLSLLFTSTLIWLFTQRSLNRRISIPFNMKRRILLVLAAGLVAFAALGHLTGKTQRSGFFPSIMRYSAGSLGALDIFLKVHDGEPQFGYYSLEPIKRIGTLLGLKVQHNVDYFGHGSFVQVGNLKTNIYTCFRHYVFDYGWAGTEVLLVVLGACFGFCYKAFVFDRISCHVNFVIYSNLAVFVFFSFLTERMFAGILTATTLVKVAAFMRLYAMLPLSSGESFVSQTMSRPRVSP